MHYWYLLCSGITSCKSTIVEYFVYNHHAEHYTLYLL